MCRKASITRSTFYIHFDNLTDVLNVVLDDALLFTNEFEETLTTNEKGVSNSFGENESLIPACQRVADSPKYRNLLMDPSLNDYIIGRIISHGKPKVIPAIQKRTGFSKSEAEALFT